MCDQRSLFCRFRFRFPFTQYALFNILQMASNIFDRLTLCAKSNLATSFNPSPPDVVGESSTDSASGPLVPTSPVVCETNTDSASDPLMLPSPVVCETSTDRASGPLLLVPPSETGRMTRTHWRSPVL